MLAPQERWARYYLIRRQTCNRRWGVLLRIWSAVLVSDNLSSHTPRPFRLMNNTPDRIYGSRPVRSPRPVTNLHTGPQDNWFLLHHTRLNRATNNLQRRAHSRLCRGLLLPGSRSYLPHSSLWPLRLPPMIFVDKSFEKVPCLWLFHR